MTDLLFQEDAYLRFADAVVISITPDGGIILDKTVFYGTSGGQPGDTGVFTLNNGNKIEIATTITGATKSEIIHVPADSSTLPSIGDQVSIEIDFERRLKLMRMHTACHLLSVICPFPITGAAVHEADSRVDFDMPEKPPKDGVTAQLMELINANHPICTKWITDEELAANPTLVKSKNVRPPKGTGRIRLVCIGDNASIDSQPCGGTHVATTGEVGDIHIGKIENKGRENRRFRIKFGSAP